MQSLNNSNDNSANIYPPINHSILLAKEDMITIVSLPSKLSYGSVICGGYFFVYH